MLLDRPTALDFRHQLRLSDLLRVVVTASGWWSSHDLNLISRIKVTG
jgi:ABC-type cobalamin/Fe3+-siderophores transport system ATPase subunit